MGSVIILRVEAIEEAPSCRSEVIDIAALLVDLSGKELDSFQTLVRQSEEVIERIAPKAMETAGYTLEALRAAPGPADAARSLLSFLGAHGDAKLTAFNVKRAKGLLEEIPWKVEGAWGKGVRDMLLEEFEGLMTPDLKLYDFAQLFKVPIPMKRRALLDARVVAEIYGKLMDKGDMMLDIEFLREAEYIIEDGL